MLVHTRDRIVPTETSTIFQEGILQHAKRLPTFVLLFRFTYPGFNGLTRLNLLALVTRRVVPLRTRSGGDHVQSAALASAF